MPVGVPHGTTVSIGGTLIGKLITLGSPSRSRGMVETTDTDSGSVRRFVQGLRDSGECTLTFRRDPDDAGQQALRTNFEKAVNDATAIVEFIITYPAGMTAASGSHTLTFDGFVIDLFTGDLDLIADDDMELSATVKIDGDITEA